MPARSKRYQVDASSPYSSDSRDVVDIEKQPSRPRRHYRRDSYSSYDSDSEDDSASSSSVASYRPMLNRAPVTPARRSRSRAGYRIPNRIMRWLCLALLAFLVLFICTLFRFTFLSAVTRVNVPLPKPAAKPAQWESFPFLKRYHGGIRSLVSRSEQVPEYPNDNLEVLGIETENVANDTVIQARDETLPFSSSIFNPYPDYSSTEYIEKYGEKRDCFLDEDETLRIPLVHHYPGVPRGFPDAIMGSNEMIGIKDDVCFDRFGRLGPYGLGYSVRKGGIGAGLEGDREGSERVWDDVPPVDFRRVDWAAAQNRCLASNSHRFRDLPASQSDRFRTMSVGAPDTKQAPQDKAQSDGKSHLPRTAFVIRTWHDFHYTPDDILYLRALISELSLLSGGEYTIHFLVQVRDETLQIWADDEVYEHVLSEALPAEFRGMATLWSERQMNLMYPGLEENWARGLSVHGVYRSTYMPMQYFAHQHPGYDYYWNWEMDARYTGHWYHLFDKVINWARAQPRKGLWERNARFYIPSVHGTWEDFRQMVRVQTDIGTNSPNNLWSAASASRPGQEHTPETLKAQQQQQGDKPIWGPERPNEPDILEVPSEGIPPTTIDKDRYEWGVDEEADLIVFNPLFDPEGTTWPLRDDVTGYDRSTGPLPPRRASIITASRLSNKLLQTMHHETIHKRHTMFSEMWPATTALHHGFKAVYVPHSVYIDRRWPTQYLESVFNAGRNGASGGARTSVFGDREHNFRGSTWFYSAGFAPNLWKRWLGYKVDNEGGEQAELAGEGRMCLPPMLLHPVKEVEMIIDDGEERGDE
ncbi:hypothetical protein CBS63078_5473 [Aspergillus niger]|uniref:Contig An08c0100, genomic contig n=4 Tax=Aspergillus niger TaxID=5061 RepID=A2QQU2_ASPNC|nr:uncharacterized protein An08g03710 [Aspergillus niger]KAI2824309.1 hypothetical protein CBS115989_720 [Aspergillus niger]KAI2832604.1 hypothetical protein CBS133816_1286 [Aspergillus niger]KAI2835336.1 hypothetical protein CBS11350_10107 [Aspergillus niger]KAI2859215.1 hypothetical protein CBS11232_2102 [Aspergillus niger]KAI2881751.1 hypothetical protein CBS115988_497 [Aspergillus niger]|eukprot:XP_001392488.1 hypothetical protein ANI_1_1862074 [Aspergillus niger CBS 513.88]